MARSARLSAPVTLGVINAARFLCWLGNAVSQTSVTAHPAAIAPLFPRELVLALTAFQAGTWRMRVSRVGLQLSSSRGGAGPTRSSQRNFPPAASDRRGRSDPIARPGRLARASLPAVTKLHPAVTPLRPQLLILITYEAR